MIPCWLAAALLLGGVQCPAGKENSDWATPTFGPSHPEFVLDFPASGVDRRTLPNGREFALIHGTITNASKALAMPPQLRIVLRDADDRVIYTFDVPALTEPLMPGESVQIDQTLVDVPKSAKVAEIGWKPE